MQATGHVREHQLWWWIVGRARSFVEKATKLRDQIEKSLIIVASGRSAAETSTPHYCDTPLRCGGRVWFGCWVV